jgi:hypothetical protein
LSYILLTDFNTWNYLIPNLDLLNESIERVNNKIIYGELNFRTNDSTIVEFKNVSHIITNVILRDLKMYGIVNWLDTPHGEIIKQFKYDVKFHIRAIGTINVQENTTDIVDIITWDAELN